MNPNLVYLVQTDTTVGFSSADAWKLSDVKQRPRTKKILQTVDSFKTLKQNTRIPNKFKRRVRRAKKTTFIYPNLKSFRVIDKKYSFYDFIHKFGVFYSTSANLSGTTYDKDFAYKNAEIIVEEKNNFNEASSSQIIKLNKTRLNRLR